jgi:hypothetical protein
MQITANGRNSPRNRPVMARGELWVEGGEFPTDFLQSIPQILSDVGGYRFFPRRPAMSLSLLNFARQASLVDEAMLLS